ncbi:MAG: N-6 DNA methylase, partial [Acidobacteria bacterium]|nr:N-6 DNA methylase [Acidobacteriota bacterium]
MHPLETYLSELRDIHNTGAAVKETSYYGALERLLNEVGKTLKPKVRCVVNIKNQGAGIPDGGLYTASQIQRATGTPAEGTAPERGCIEVKGTSADVDAVADSAQVRKYLQHYRQVLITNYRDFLLVGYDAEGRAKNLERYSLAASEGAFWTAAAHTRAVATEHGERFLEYLRRVMLTPAPLTSPEELARFLASYARDARARLEGAELPALASVRGALEEALGLKFEGAEGEHFFRSTLVQTLFYGIFSAWVLWDKEHARGGERRAQFDWRTAAYLLRVPMIKALFYRIASPETLKEFNLVEVLDWTAATLNRVERAEFFQTFEEAQAVQYFYEPFLQEFDPVLRKQLGVWYTPREIVRYMVERVDTVLREELGIAEGLADERVYVLDPCCGTGAYLVEVLRRIGATLKERGEDALAAHELKQAAMHRVFGFEILPAPFVVAHLQLGLLLQNMDAPLGVLGNPPYNGFAGVGMVEERSLSDAYRTTKHAPAPQGQGLNDLYVRFFRMAERRIAEMSGQGVVCFISNYSWLDGLSFTGMRERYLEAFDRVWIDCLNGDKYKTGKLTPDGKPDPSVFSVKSNPEGIQVGTAVALLARKHEHEGARAVEFRHFWGKEKTAELLGSLTEDGDAHPYHELAPPNELGLPFLPLQFEASYLNWPLLPELFPVSFPGVKTSRDDVVVDIDRARLERRMEQYFDASIIHEEMRRIAPGVMQSVSAFKAEETRDYLRKRGYLPQNIIRYLYRPFDLRWLYWEPETNLVDRKREDYFRHIFKGNQFIFTTGRTRKNEGEPPILTHLLTDLNCMDSGARGIPLYVLASGGNLFQQSEATHKPNLSDEAVAYLEDLGCDEADLFYHSYSIVSSPAYRHEHGGAIRHNWPRIPLPATREALHASAALGRRVAALL